VPRTIDNSNSITDNIIIENNHHRIDPIISNVPVPLKELDIQSHNFFMLWYFSNITKSVTVIEVGSTDVAQSENNNLLIEQPMGGESNLIISEMAYKNRKLVPELAKDVFTSDTV